MDRNTAIVRIILGSAEVIRSLALDAIAELDQGSMTLNTTDTVGDMSHSQTTTLDPTFASQFIGALDATSVTKMAPSPAPTETEAADKKKRGRPRRADAKEVLENTVPVEPAVAPEPEVETDVEEVNPVLDDSFEDDSVPTPTLPAKSEPAPVVETPKAEAVSQGGAITVDWVKANRETAVDRGREKASAHVARSDAGAARNFLKSVTGKIRISDCTDAELAKYLNVAPEEG